MPTQEFALDGTGTRRIQVFRENDVEKENLIVLMDRGIIGSISQAELITGREIRLKDDSVLKIQFVNNQIQVLRNGQLLQPVEPAKRPGSGSSLPNKSIYVLTHPSVTTFAQEMGDATWGQVWSKLFTSIFLGVGATVLLLCIAATIVSSRLQAYQRIDFGYLIVVIIVVAILLVATVPLLFFIGEGIWYLLARAFGGQGKFVRQCYTTLLFSVPVLVIDLVSYFVFGWIPFGVWLFLLIASVMSVYSIVLQVLSIRATHSLSGIKATAAILIPVVAPWVLLVYFSLLYVAAHSTFLPH